MSNNAFSYASALAAASKPVADKPVSGTVSKKHSPKASASATTKGETPVETKVVVEAPVSHKRLTIDTSREAFEAALDALDGLDDDDFDIKTPSTSSTASCSSPVKSLNFDWAADDLDDLDWDEDCHDDNLRIDTKTGSLVTAAEFAAGLKNTEPVYQWGDHLKYRFMPTIYEAKEPVEEARKPKVFISFTAAFLDLAAIADDLFSALSNFESILFELAPLSLSLFTTLSAFEAAVAELSPVSPAIFTDLSAFETAVLELGATEPSVFSELCNFEVAVLALSPISASIFTTPSNHEIVVQELSPISPSIFSELSAFELATANRGKSRLEELLARQHSFDERTLDGYKAAARLNTARLYKKALQNVVRAAAPVVDDYDYVSEVDKAAFYNYVGPRVEAQVNGIVLRLEHSRVANRRAIGWMVNDPWPLFHARNAPPAIRPPPGLATIRPPPGLALPAPAPRPLLPPGLGAPVARAEVEDLFLNDLNPAPQAPLKLESDLDWECADFATVKAIFPRIQDVPGPGERFAEYRRKSAEVARFEHPAPPTTDYHILKKQRGFPISAARFNYNSRWAAPQYKEPEPVFGADEDSFLDDLSCKPDAIRTISRTSSVTSTSTLSVLSAPASLPSGQGLGKVSSKVFSTLNKPAPSAFSWRGIKRSARSALASVTRAL